MLIVFSFDFGHITAIIIILAEIFNDHACLRRAFSKEIFFIHLFVDLFIPPFAYNRIDTQVQNR